MTFPTPAGRAPLGRVLTAMVTPFRDEDLSVDLDAERWIVLRVADDGVGLPPGVEASGGASLGLQLVRLFVEQVHGTLEVHRNGGTAVTIRFPKG